MKRTTKALCALLVLLLVSACSNPFSAAKDAKNEGAQAKGASIHLVLGGAAARTLVPNATDLSSAIVSYAIRLSSPGFPDITITRPAPLDDGVMIDNLAPVQWTISVQARNDNDDPVAAGSNTATAGVDVNCQVELYPDLARGYGDIELSILFPTSLGIDSATATLKSGRDLATAITTPIPVVIDAAAGQPGFSKIDIARTQVKAGSPLLSISFKRAGVELAVMNEVVWVFRNLTTRASRTIPAAYFGSAPSAPRDLVLSQGPAGSVSLFWTATSSFADAFIVERAAGDAGSWVLLEGNRDPGFRTYVDQSAAPGTGYRYRVAAKNRFGISAWTEGAIATPTAPVLLSMVAEMRSESLKFVYQQGEEVRELESPGAGPLPMFAQGIAVAGDDVYVVGSYLDQDNPQLTDPVGRAILWKNGKALPLTIPVDDVTFGSAAIAVGVAGTDVYVSGVIHAGSATHPGYWKNGIWNYLPKGEDPNYNYLPADIAIEGSDVYIAGCKRNTDLIGHPIYWKNGVLKDFILAEYSLVGSPADTPPPFPEPRYGGIAVLDGTVYLTASFYDSALQKDRAAYWKDDGTPASPDIHYLNLGQASSGRVEALAAHRGKIYFAGAVSTGSFLRPVVWVNDEEPIPLALGDPIFDGKATGIAFSGDDLFVIGNATNTSEMPLSMVWWNGFYSALNEDDQTIPSLTLALGLAAGPSPALPGSNSQASLYIDASNLLTQLTLSGLPETCEPSTELSLIPNIQGLTNLDLVLDGVSGMGFTNLNNVITCTLPSELQPGQHVLTLFGSKDGILYDVSASFIRTFTLASITGEKAPGAQITLQTNLTDPAATFVVKLDGSIDSNVVDNGDGSLTYTLPAGLLAGTHMVTVEGSKDGITLTAAAALTGSLATTLLADTYTAGGTAELTLNVDDANGKNIKVYLDDVEQAGVAIDGTQLNLVTFTLPADLTAGSHTIKVELTIDGTTYSGSDTFLVPN